MSMGDAYYRSCKNDLDQLLILRMTTGNVVQEKAYETKEDLKATPGKITKSEEESAKKYSDELAKNLMRYVLSSCNFHQT